ncbi:hypothetical protein RNJ44_04293 [Nakaseomyces bracarensis]|uniref:LisH domain-containing protein n=1 Tax=Nakaseomyces bracarensis TaxID=273131 RepID=A0ABR4NUI7_9SACH
MDYTQILIAQYLQEKNLNETLASFLKETECSYSDIANHAEYGEKLSLESIVRDRVHFKQDTSTNRPINRELVKFNSWNYAKHFETFQLPPIGSLVIDSKFIKTPNLGNQLLLSSADRKTYFIKIEKDNGDFDKWRVVNHNSVCKFCGAFEDTDICYFVTIDGNLILYDGFEGKEIRKYSLETRIVSHLKLLRSGNSHNSWYFIYTGLDNKLRAAILNLDDISTPLFDIIAETKLLSKSTSLEAITNPKNSKPIILVSRLDYTSILVFSLTLEDKLEHYSNIALNDAQFMSHSFNALDMKLITMPGDIQKRNLVVATSHNPYMRLIVVNLEDLSDMIATLSNGEIRTYYDKVLENILTKVPQDAYSQPIIVVDDSIGGIMVGSNEGLFAVDLNKKDSWKFKVTNDNEENRIKTIDIKSDGTIFFGTSEKDLYLCTATS